MSKRRQCPHFLREEPPTYPMQAVVHSGNCSQESATSVCWMWKGQVNRAFEDYSNYSWAAFCSCWSRVLVQVVIQGSWLISQRSRGHFLPRNTPSSPVSLCFQAGPLPLYWVLFMCCMVTVSWYNSAGWRLVLSIVFFFFNVFVFILVAGPPGTLWRKHTWLYLL